MQVKKILYKFGNRNITPTIFFGSTIIGWLLTEFITKKIETTFTVLVIIMTIWFFYSLWTNQSDWFQDLRCADGDHQKPPLRNSLKLEKDEEGKPILTGECKACGKRFVYMEPQEQD